jgi:flagellar assembly factor FliW
MKIKSKPYGEIEIDARQVIRFPQGLLGFEDRHDWALLDSTQAPFLWLQSLDETNLAFVLLQPDFFRTDYILDLSDLDRESLGDPDGEDLLVFAICTIPEDQSRMTANLQGPVVVNRKDGLGRQTIQASPQWKVRHLILEEMAAAGAR